MPKRKGPQPEAPPKRRGRPPTLTARLQAGIFRLIERGNYPETAAVAKGVPASTFWDWMRRGKPEDGAEPYRSFVLGVDQARAKAELSLVEVIRRGDSKDRKKTRAAGWLLERTRSKRFGAIVRHRVEDELEGLLDVAEGVLAPADFKRLCAALAAVDSEAEIPPDRGSGSGERAGAAGTVH